MPWGSYGEMLWQGIYCYDKDTNSHMIFRTGAFCPSIYLHIPEHTRSLSGSLLGYKTIP